MTTFNTIIGKSIDDAVHFLEMNELVGIPTETVYGLAADAFSEKAVEKVFRIKKRPFSNPLIVHVDRIAEVKQLVQEIPDTAEALLDAFAPGPITVILRKNSLLPNIVTAGRPEVAVRIPSHPQTLELLRRIDFPLVAPSANLFTTISPTQPIHVSKNFSGLIPYILDGGDCGMGIESTIVGFESNGTPIVYRQGAITPEDIEWVVGKVKLRGGEEGHPMPGTFPHHYAPATSLVVVNRFSPLRHIAPERTGLLCFNRFYADLPHSNQFVLSPQGDLREAARNLYKGLHYLDDCGLDIIIAERCPHYGLGQAINDRLQRAAVKEYR